MVRETHPTDRVINGIILMPNYRRSNTAGGTYFFTVVTFCRRKILCDTCVRKALREGIQSTQKTLPFTIDAWVLLPDHLHCIWRLPASDARFSARWAMIKRHVSKACDPRFHHNNQISQSRKKRNELDFWQRRFWEHQIRDEMDYERHMDYLHFNPLKHGLVGQVKDWPHSTFHRYVKQGVYEENWGGDYSVPVDASFGE